MSNKTCCFVTGSEGSGTYMLTEALVAAGCFYIPEEMESDFEKVLKLDVGSSIVIRRSIPHRNEFIDLYTIASIAQIAGYDVKAIAIFREPNATWKSVNKRSGTSQKDVFENMMGAMTCISELSMGFQVLPITYEAVVWSSGFRRWLFEEYLGLTMPDYPFYNANMKYYQESLWQKS